VAATVIDKALKLDPFCKYGKSQFKTVQKSSIASL
jgi:hypothetical protein